MNPVSIVIHGGAGTISPEQLTPELETQYRQGLQQALHAGYQVLRKGGTSLDAVTAAVISLEDNILFNAGRGSVFTHDETHEMDASIMNGKDLGCGAVAGVSHIKNPVELARAVMEKSQHVLLCGKGAEDFARLQDIAFQETGYFYSVYRHQQLHVAKNTNTVMLDHSALKEKKFGTVGAAACDSFGNIAAATSTGGMTNKRWGRIGDTPLIGSGTYANNKTCAISCTGHGELFIKAVTSYDVSCLMEYKGYSLQQACEEVVMNKLVAIEGEGGLVGVDAKGNTAMVFNSEGMYRGMKTAEKEIIAIYR